MTRTEMILLLMSDERHGVREAIALTAAAPDRDRTADALFRFAPARTLSENHSAQGKAWVSPEKKPVGSLSLLFSSALFCLRECGASMVAQSSQVVRLDRSVFYPDGEGQPSGIGCLRWPGGETPVVDM